jgi:hypothetical protein
MHIQGMSQDIDEDKKLLLPGQDDFDFDELWGIDDVRKCKRKHVRNLWCTASN